MALLERGSTLIRANLNDLIDKAEEPEKMIKQIILDMQNQLMQVKTQVAIAIADQHLLEKKQVENREKSTSWMRKAELAVAGRSLPSEERQRKPRRLAARRCRDRPVDGRGGARRGGRCAGRGRSAGRGAAGRSDPCRSPRYRDRRAGGRARDVPEWENHNAGSRHSARSDLGA